MKLARAVVLAVLLAPAAAAAAPPPAPAPADAAQADVHFRRGVELFKERTLDSALVEFRRAYQLAPSYKVLFNLARCHAEMREHARAWSLYRQFLDEGGAEIPAERRAAVEAELARLAPRVAHVTVTADAQGARLLVDDEIVATLPLRAPLVIESGRHRITVDAGARGQQTRSAELAGGDRVDVKFDLPAAATSAPAAPAPLAAPAAATAPAPADTAPRATRFPWTTVGIVSTVALAGAATTTGVLALDAKGARTAALDAGPGDRAELDCLARKASGFAVATDVLAVSAAVVGGATLWYALTAKPDRAAASSSGLRLDVGAARVGVAGTF